MTYLCYLLLSKHRQIFETSKLRLNFGKQIFEWMSDPRGLQTLCRLLFVPFYHKITGTSMPRFSFSCKQLIQLGSQIQLVDWYFMEDLTILRFYGSTVEPYKLTIQVTERVFSLKYIYHMERIDVLFHG